jgi:hypothetical protein
LKSQYLLFFTIFGAYRVLGLILGLSALAPFLGLISLFPELHHDFHNFPLYHNTFGGLNHQNRFPG